jgi:serine-type D-Ala-D-Ala carboxypeptidase/endopeptidase (penicillin-binding protein 4)
MSRAALPCAARHFALGLALLLCAAAGRAGAAEPAGLREALAPLVEQGGVAVGENGRAVFVYRPGAYVPASILKLATALAAFQTLGEDYRFRTEVYRAGDLLYLRGYGDPLLTSEEWALLAGELRAAGLFERPLAALVLDESAFAPGLEVDGASDSLNPYDARQGALVANFNTVFVEVDAAGQVRSAEPQTPLTPIARRLGARLPPGQQRINLTAEGVAGVAYAGELARAVFEQGGARIAGPSRTGRVPAGLKPVWVHRSSRPLREVVGGMLEFSNNFTANQIVLAMALHSAGEPARLEPGLALVRRHLEESLGLRPEQFTLREGSGLSRHNRIELTAMLKVVDAFHPWADLLKPYGKAPLQVPAKTGTLTGVYTLAGFLPAPQGVRRPFVIMLNQPRHTRSAVLRRLVRAYAGRPAAPAPAAAAR